MTDYCLHLGCIMQTRAIGTVSERRGCHADRAAVRRVRVASVGPGDDDNAGRIVSDQTARGSRRCGKERCFLFFIAPSIRFGHRNTVCQLTYSRGLRLKSGPLLTDSLDLL